MNGDKKVIAYLNRALANELVAINQYMLHSKMYSNWGFKQLGESTYKESIEEMKHADWLIERILFLDGAPTLHGPNKLSIGKDVPQMLASDLALEMEAMALLKEARDYCLTVSDHITGALFEKILANEEEHVDMLSTQLDLIKQVGLPNYLQTKI